MIKRKMTNNFQQQSEKQHFLGGFDKDKNDFSGLSTHVERVDKVLSGRSGKSPGTEEKLHQLC